MEQIPFEKICEERKILEQVIFGEGSNSRYEFNSLEILSKKYEAVKSFLKQEKMGRTKDTETKVNAIIKVICYTFAHYSIKSISKSKNLGVKNVLFVEPPENYHRSNVFHKLIMDVFSVATNFTGDFLLPPIVPKNTGNFVKDKMHFSKEGAKTCVRSLHLFIDTLAENLYNTKDVNCTVSVLRDTFNSDPLERTQKRNHHGYRFKNSDKFKHENYKNGSSSKYTASWKSKNSLRETKKKCKLPLGFLNKNKLFVAHCDSLFKHLIGENEFSVNNRKNGKLLRLPACVTVTPGCSTFDLLQELEGSQLFKKFSEQSFIGLYFLGTNEKLHVLACIDGLLCNLGLISHKKCSMCYRHSNRPHVMPNFLIDFLEKCKSAGSFYY